MALFTTTTFSTFAGLLLAARKLATDPDPLNRSKALADLATNGKALAAALRDSGLAPLQAELTRRAEDHARHFTHPGPARDDAVALFWQVAPDAFADPGVFAGHDLDPDRITAAMAAAIKRSPHGPDFTATHLAEPFFRSVTRQTLDAMLAEADYIETITPELWRESLARHGVTIELAQAIKADTEELLARVATLQAELATMQEAQAARVSGVTETALIRLVRPIAKDVEDTAQAVIELTRAVEIARKVQEEGRHGSNLGAFVDEVLRRTADLSAEGEHRAAISELDAALAREEAESQARQIRLLARATDEHLLARDPEGAAAKIARRVALETPADRDPFEALRAELQQWYERGRNKGLWLDLEVAIALATICRDVAENPDQSGGALGDLGIALTTLGERESGTARLEAAVAAFRASLEELTRDRVPLDWARTQTNLGTALVTVGERESGTARLEAAVAAYRAALEECTRDRAPLAWATAQMNLGTALRTLGERESGTARLEAAVAAYRAALEEWTRERVPLDWARTQNNLGNAFLALGEREGGTARLEAAVAAFRAALEERTRERVPLDWAKTQVNLGNSLQTLGGRELGTARLEEAVAAYRGALEEWTRDRMPFNWAITQMNLGNALARLGERERGTARLEAAVAAYLAALEETTRNRTPLDWANVLCNQGSAMHALAERSDDPAMARRALNQLREGAAVLRDGGDVPRAELFERWIPEAEALVARLSGGAAR